MSVYLCRTKALFFTLNQPFQYADVLKPTGYFTGFVHGSDSVSSGCSLRFSYWEIKKYPICNLQDDLCKHRQPAEGSPSQTGRPQTHTSVYFIIIICMYFFSSSQPPYTPPLLERQHLNVQTDIDDIGNPLWLSYSTNAGTSRNFSSKLIKLYRKKNIDMSNGKLIL